MPTLALIVTDLGPTLGILLGVGLVVLAFGVGVPLLLNRMLDPRRRPRKPRKDEE